MNILCPITSAADIAPLSIYGAEFFCGYLPPWWVEKYSDNADFEQFGCPAVPLNNRNVLSSNVTDYEELKAVVAQADIHQCTLFLTLNAKYYPEYLYEDLHRYVGELAQAGVKKLIVSDVGTIAFLNTHFPQMAVSISCLSQVTNTEAVAFYLQFPNVERIVLPRHMATAEIKTMALAFPHIEFEYFIFSNKCLYDDGYCRSIHAFTPICKDRFSSGFYAAEGALLPQSKEETLHQQEALYRKWTQDEPKELGYCTPSFCCTACSLLSLCDVENITAVKLSIRGHDLQERLHQTRMARAAIEAAQAGDGVVLQQVVSALYGKEMLCKNGFSCMMK
ncbi:U32 family peptidase [Bengtsoniella intestinalis]|uniref:U32 family peptidase n=1 Tax=Bengtsoniella intestinalis TaxID=3073143 RepID=UPI00391F184A